MCLPPRGTLRLLPHLLRLLAGLLSLPHGHLGGRLRHKRIAIHSLTSPMVSVATEVAS